MQWEESGGGGGVFKIFWSIELNDLWSKKICRPMMIVWCGAIFILRWSCFHAWGWYIASWATFGPLLFYVPYYTRSQYHHSCARVRAFVLSWFIGCAKNNLIASQWPTVDKRIGKRGIMEKVVCRFDWESSVDETKWLRASPWSWW